ncbi:hypothetical protein QBC45DRAFT_403596 [Copromyces sp. CBS 386.78]|nr:hypothetical protein QBC45DRAFT_403596 [Copromyces sp. CBS 386.78]
MTREETNNMSAGKDAEDSNGQASSPVMVSAALGDQFAQVRKSIFTYPAMPLNYSGLLYVWKGASYHTYHTRTCRQHSKQQDMEISDDLCLRSSPTSVFTLSL